MICLWCVWWSIVWCIWCILYLWSFLWCMRCDIWCVLVLDARDPMGTRSRHVEEYMRKHCSHKHLIIVLNKCDLVPTWAIVCDIYDVIYDAYDVLWCIWCFMMCLWCDYDVFQARWVKLLSPEYPTLAFHASITNPFGKGTTNNTRNQATFFTKKTNFYKYVQNTCKMNPKNPFVRKTKKFSCPKRV